MKNKKDKTTIQIYRSDAKKLDRIVKDQGLNGKQEVIKRMIKLMKDMKWENELK